MNDKVKELVNQMAEMCLMWESNRLDGRMEHTAAILAKRILSRPGLIYRYTDDNGDIVVVSLVEELKKDEDE